MIGETGRRGGVEGGDRVNDSVRDEEAVPFGGSCGYGGEISICIGRE